MFLTLFMYVLCQCNSGFVLYECVIYVLCPLLKKLLFFGGWRSLAEPQIVNSSSSDNLKMRLQHSLTFCVFLDNTISKWLAVPQEAQLHLCSDGKFARLGPQNVHARQPFKLQIIV